MMMIKNVEDIIKLFNYEPVHSNPLMNKIRREVAILDAITACDIIIAEQDVVADEYLQGFVKHWTNIRRELLNELPKCRI